MMGAIELISLEDGTHILTVKIKEKTNLIRICFSCKALNNINSKKKSTQKRVKLTKRPALLSLTWSSKDFLLLF
jgi:hypothetical protein